MTYKNWFFIGVFAISLVFSTNINAGSLSAYKDQKHSKRERVTSENCPAEFTKRCIAECKDDATVCEAACKANAKPFCDIREDKRKREKDKLWKRFKSLFP